MARALGANQVMIAQFVLSEHSQRVSDAMRDEPNSLRARYGNPRNDMINALHGSASPEESEREIDIIFPHILHGNGKKRHTVKRLLPQINDSACERVAFVT